MDLTESLDAIDALLNFFHGAASIGDFDGYFSCFHPNGRFLGTDKTENWTVSEFMEFSRPHFTPGRSAWTFNPIPDSRKYDVFPVGPIAAPSATQGPAFATFDEHLESVSFETTARGTGTVIWDTATGKWLIAHYYLSFPIPNDLAKDMCKQIGIFEKKQVAPSQGTSAETDDWLSTDCSKGKKTSKGKKR